jgi:hypothetical protein
MQTRGWRRRGVDLQHGGAPVFHFQAVFRDVAVRAAADIQLLAVGAGQQRLGPVVVDGAGQVAQFDPGSDIFVSPGV